MLQYRQNIKVEDLDFHTTIFLQLRSEWERSLSCQFEDFMIDSKQSHSGTDRVKVDFSGFTRFESRFQQKLTQQNSTKLQSISSLVVQSIMLKMLLQVKKTCQLTLLHMLESISYCINLMAPDRKHTSSQKVSLKLGQMKNDVLRLQDQIRLLVDCLQSEQKKVATSINKEHQDIYTDYNCKRKGKLEEEHKLQLRSLSHHPQFPESMPWKQKQDHFRSQIQIFKLKNNKLSQELEFIKFNNSTLRKQLYEVKNCRMDNENLKTAIRDIESELIQDTKRVFSRIDFLVRPREAVDIQNRRGQRFDMFNNKPVTHDAYLRPRNEFGGFERFDMTPPMEEISKSNGVETLRKDNIRRSQYHNYQIDDYPLDKDLGQGQNLKDYLKQFKLCEDKESVGKVQSLNFQGNRIVNTVRKKTKSVMKEIQRANRQSRETHQYVPSKKKSQELAKLVAQQGKMMQFRERYFSTDLI